MEKLNLDNINMLKTAIIESTILTFEELAFLEVILYERDVNSEKINKFVMIDILQPFKAVLILEIPELLLKTIAENIYSVDANNIKKTDMNDCLIELLNILCGNFLKIFLHKEKNYSIHVPEITEIKIDKNGYDNEISINFNAEISFFSVKLFF